MLVLAFVFYLISGLPCEGSDLVLDVGGGASTGSRSPEVHKVFDTAIITVRCALLGIPRLSSLLCCSLGSTSAGEASSLLVALDKYG